MLGLETRKAKTCLGVSRRFVCGEEPDRRLLSDELSDAFIEVGVALQEGGGVDQLVKECFDQGSGAALKHGARDRVIEPPECGVRADAAHTELVLPCLANRCGFSFGTFAIEVAL